MRSIPAVLAIALTACASNPPDVAASPEAAAVAAQCAQLREEINKGEVARREAAPNSSFRVIADAAAAKQDQNVELARQSYAALGCGAPPAVSEGPPAPAPTATQPPL